MKKTILVLKHELIATLSRRSYLLISFGIPILGILTLAIVSVVRGNNSIPVEAPPKPVQEFRVEGYVDQTGLIEIPAADIPPKYLIAYQDEADAKEALQSGEITAYYMVPEDYVETGELIYVHPTYRPSSTDGQDWVMRKTLLINMLGGDAELAEKVWYPMQLKVTNLTPVPQYDRYASEDCSSPGPACGSSVLVRYIPFIMTILFFMFITQGSSLLIRNVSSEKENQVMEILLVSTNPQQLLTGKLIGLGIASLLATIVWLVSGIGMLRIGGGILNLPDEFAIPTSLLIWSVVFFILGYAVYASLMAGAGALVPNMKEVTQATWLVMLPLMFGYIVGIMTSSEAPHAALPTLLSLFPLTSSIVMMMRLTIGGVPMWQSLLSVGLLILTAIFVVRTVARMFRAQTLLSGEAFSVRRFASTLLGH